MNLDAHKDEVVRILKGDEVDEAGDGWNILQHTINIYILGALDKIISIWMT